MEGEKNRVLLIEDNPGDARLIRELLSAEVGASFFLEHADRLSTGLARLAQGNIDVILLDLSLPDSHGLDGLNKICAQASKAPVVVLSGLSDEAVAINAVQEGAQDYLVKGSVDSDLLIRSLHYAIERQHLQIAFRESEARYRLLADNAADIIWTANMKSQITYVSPSITRLLGYTVEETIKLKIRDILTPDSAEQARKVIKDQIAIRIPRLQYPPLVLTLEHVRKDGSTLWAEVMLSLLWDKDGKLIGIMGATRDITERKKAEEALRQSEQRYRLLAENVKDIIWTRDMNLKLTYTSPSVLEMSGYSVEEVMSMSFDESLTPASLEILRPTLNRVLDAAGKGQSDLPEVLVLETELIHKDGSITPVEMKINLLRDSDGRPIGFLGVTRDITGRKKAEKALRESEEELQAIFDNARDGIVLLDAEGRVIRVNRRVLEVGGYDIDEVVDKRFDLFEIVTPESIEKMLTAKTTILSGGEVPAFECELTTKSGKRLIIEVHVTPFNRNGKFIGSVAVMRDITERKKAEDALRESEERYRELFENANDIIYTHDLAGNFTSINKAAERVTGYARSEVLGMNISRILAPESLELARQMTARKVSQGGSSRYELEIVAKDGHRILLEVSNRLICEEDKPVGVQGIARDITERKKMEEALQTSERQYRLLAENVKDVIWIVDMNLRLTYTSSSITQLTGYRHEEYLTKTLEEILTPASFEFVTNLFTEELALEDSGHGGLFRARTFEAELICKDGSATPVEMKANVLRDADDRPIGVLGVSRDISDRKLVEKALRQSEHNYKVLFESTIDGVFVTDAETMKIVLANQNAANMCGFASAENVIGINPLDLVHPDDKERALGFFMQDAFGEGEQEAHEFRVITKDGREIWVSGVGTRIEYGDKRAVLSSIRDVTERKRMEEQLRLASRLAAVGELAAGVAHELNNPIAAIQGFAQFLTARQGLDETIRKDLNTIYRESQRAAKITQNLLSFARRHEPEKNLISLNEAIEKTLELRIHTMKLNNIELVAELAPDLPKTLVDLHQMQQVFINIINNAEQAMVEAHGKGRLVVRTRKVGNMVQISFADDGPGISEENMKRIFDPFFTTKDVGKGTGLGLSICYGLVEAHGGRIYARSQLGQGATFVVEIPIVFEDRLVAEAALLNPGSRGVAWKKPKRQY